MSHRPVAERVGASYRAAVNVLSHESPVFGVSYTVEEAAWEGWTVTF